MLRRFVRWFGALPSVVKILLAIAALIVLGLSVLLSPLMVVLTVMVLAVAVLALVFRALRGRPLKTWGMVAASSLVLVVLFSGISGALYGGGQPGGRQQERVASSGPDRNIVRQEKTVEGSGSIMVDERGCSGVERAAGKSRASGPIWRTRDSFSRSAKAAALKCCSTSRCAPSPRSPCPPPHAALRG